MDPTGLRSLTWCDQVSEPQELHFKLNAMALLFQLCSVTVSSSQAQSSLLLSLDSRTCRSVKLFSSDEQEIVEISLVNVEQLSNL